MDYRARRVTVMGLGHFGGGVGAARWLARQGAAVTVTDLAGPDVLRDAAAALAPEPIAAWRLGRHEEDDFRRADLVVVNPAVKPGDRFLELARQSGADAVTEIELFLRHFPGRVIGVTGSNGKSTTAAMCAAVLRADGRRAWLGGNLGGSLLDRLDEMAPDDWAVLEISSFQLFHASPAARMPDVAIVTNCTPNHLDWHGSFAQYAAAKQRMLGARRAGFQPASPDRGAGFQPASGSSQEPWQVENLPHVAVLNTDLSGAWTREWLGSPQLGELWGHLLGHLWGERQTVRVDWEIAGSSLRVALEATRGGRWANGLHFEGQLVGAGSAWPLLFDQTEPGRYEATLAAPAAGAYLLTVSEPGGEYGGAFPMMLPYPVELAAFGPDHDALRQIARITGGEVVRDEILPPPPGTGRDWLPIGRALLWAAACGFLLDLGLRRLIL